MENFYAANILNKVWGLALITFIIAVSACNEVDPKDTVPSTGNEKKCYSPESAWAIGSRFTTDGKRVKYVDIPVYDASKGNGAEIKWVYLESVISEEAIGAVKLKELLDVEIPEGASPGDYLKLSVRIDEKGWSYVPDVKNIKIGGFDVLPEGAISIEMLTTHLGTSTKKTGDEWEYYEVVVPRHPYYSVYVESQYEIPCEE